MFSKKAKKDRILELVSPNHKSSIVGVFVIEAEPKIIHVAGQGQYSCRELYSDEKETLNAMIGNGELVFEVEENCLEPIPDGRRIIPSTQALRTKPCPRGWY